MVLARRSDRAPGPHRTQGLGVEESLSQCTRLFGGHTAIGEIEPWQHLMKKPWQVIAQPGGYCLAPQGEERVGDVSNVVFANGWVARDNGEVLIYYGSSDTRTHVATSTIDRLLDYVTGTPADGQRSSVCVQHRCELIRKNLGLGLV